MGAHISIPLYQRTIGERYRLLGRRCVQCRKINFPQKGVCPYCRESAEFEEVVLSGEGEIYSYTVIAPGGAPPEFRDLAQVKGEYIVGLIQLDEGPKIAAQIVDVSPKELKIGMRVKASLRRIYEEEGVIRYGYKFAPALKG